MFKKFLVVLSVVTIAINCFAQARFGFSTGMDINFPLSDALYQRPTPGYSYGIVGEYLITEQFGIKAELLGSDIRYGYAKLSLEQISAIQQCKLNLISLPVQGIYRISLTNGLFLDAGVGFQYSMLCSGSAYICDQYGQGDLWELCMDSTKAFDFPEYHEIKLNKVNSNLFSGLASLEISSKHLGIGAYYNKGLTPFSKQAPFASGTNHKTLNKCGIKLSYYL